VSAERLRRFFTKLDGGYRIAKSVRDVCVFARQDVTRDPPFSRLDLILCRNVLIYLSAPLQRRLMSVFHYALQAGTLLVLGHAETIGTHADMFQLEDRKHRIYSKKGCDRGRPVHGRQSRPGQAPSVRPGRRATTSARAGRGQPRAARPVRAGRRGHRRGPADRPLSRRDRPIPRAAAGDPSLHLFKMAREGLLHALRSP
jgi:two-component system CheB/CheR fusion protein